MGGHGGPIALPTPWVFPCRVCWLPWPTSATRLEWMPSSRTMWTPPQTLTQPMPPTPAPQWKTTSSRPSPRTWRPLKATSLPQCTEQPGWRQGECLGPRLSPGLLSGGLLPGTADPRLLQPKSPSMPFCILAAASQSTPEVPVPKGASLPPTQTSFLAKGFH